MRSGWRLAVLVFVALRLQAHAADCPSLLLPPTFKTMRLSARQFRRSDTEPLRRLVKELNSPIFARDFNLEEIAAKRNRLNEESFLYVLRRNKPAGTGRTLGAVFLTRVNPARRPGLVFPLSDDPWLEIGYFIARERWSRGLASEAVFRVLGLAAKHLRPAGILANANENNFASLRILKKFGFRRVGQIGPDLIFVAMPVETFSWPDELQPGGAERGR